MIKIVYLVLRIDLGRPIRDPTRTTGSTSPTPPPTAKVCNLLHHVPHLDLVELVRDVDVLFEAVLEELLEGLLLLVAVVAVIDDVVVVLFHLKLEI